MQERNECIFIWLTDSGSLLMSRMHSLNVKCRSVYVSFAFRKGHGLLVDLAV